MRLILVYFFSLICLFVSAQETDTNLVLKLYSGFGEHSIKTHNRIIYQLSFASGYSRGKISKITPDSIMLSNKKMLPIRFISEIGYYSKKDKTTKLVGAAIVLLSGVLAWQASLEYDASDNFAGKVGGFAPTLVTLGIGVAMITMKLRLYKIPNPWQLQASREIKSGFIYK